MIKYGEFSGGIFSGNNKLRPNDSIQLLKFIMADCS